MSVNGSLRNDNVKKLWDCISFWSTKSTRNLSKNCFGKSNSGDLSRFLEALFQGAKNCLTRTNFLVIK